MITSTVNLMEKNISGRYNAGLHSEIVRRMLHEEMCATFADWSDTYLPNLSSYLFSEVSCETIHRGIWKNGYLLGLRSLISLFSDMNALNNDGSSAADFKAAISEYYSKINGNHLMEMYHHAQSVPKLLANFLVQ